MLSLCVLEKAEELRQGRAGGAGRRGRASCGVELSWMVLPDGVMVAGLASPARAAEQWARSTSKCSRRPQRAGSRTHALMRLASLICVTLYHHPSTGSSNVLYLSYTSSWSAIAACQAEKALSSRQTASSHPETARLIQACTAGVCNERTRTAGLAVQRGKFAFEAQLQRPQPPVCVHCISYARFLAFHLSSHHTLASEWRKIWVTK